MVTINVFKNGGKQNTLYSQLTNEQLGLYMPIVGEMAGYFCVSGIVMRIFSFEIFHCSWRFQRA